MEMKQKKQAPLRVYTCVVLAFLSETKIKWVNSNRYVKTPAGCSDSDQLLIYEDGKNAFNAILLNLLVR